MPATAKAKNLLRTACAVIVVAVAPVLELKAAESLPAVDTAIVAENPSPPKPAVGAKPSKKPAAAGPKADGAAKPTKERKAAAPSTAAKPADMPTPPKTAADAAPAPKIILKSDESKVSRPEPVDQSMRPGGLAASAGFAGAVAGSGAAPRAAAPPVYLVEPPTFSAVQSFPAPATGRGNGGRLTASGTIEQAQQSVRTDRLLERIDRLDEDGNVIIVLPSSGRGIGAARTPAEAELQQLDRMRILDRLEHAKGNGTVNVLIGP